MPDDIAAAIMEIIARQTKVPAQELTLDASLEALGLDSIAMVETVFAIEERFDITVPFNANQPDGTADFDVSHLGGLIESVTRLIEARG